MVFTRRQSNAASVIQRAIRRSGNRRIGRMMLQAMRQRRNMPPVPGVGAPRQWPKRYRPSDTAHRHRIEDPQPKTVNVSGYNRRN